MLRQFKETALNGGTGGDHKECYISFCDKQSGQKYEEKREGPSERCKRAKHVA